MALTAPKAIQTIAWLRDAATRYSTPGQSHNLLNQAAALEKTLDQDLAAERAAYDRLVAHAQTYL